MSFIISPKELATKLNNEQVTIIDVRSDLSDSRHGEIVYKQSHLPKAYFLDLEKDLSSSVKKHGGNHPLPNMDDFIKKLGEVGVRQNVPVVIYDEANDMYASRAWWLIHYVGHENVFVLDGGFKGWMEAGYEVTNEIPPKQTGEFAANIRKDLTVMMEDVKHRNNDTILIDSRARERYLGLKEPLYDKAGHIPGAKNYFWGDLFDQNGLWKSEEKLFEHFRHLPKDKQIIVSCGSGVSACPNFLALKQIGFQDVKLYPGSFSDWISYEANEIETKEE